MSGFSADWLTLREPHDRRARNPAVFDAVAALFARHFRVRVVDLACGTGSSMRALGPRLSAKQAWTLVDNDPELLARVTARATANDAAITTIALDLNRDLESALDNTADLVTTSALLDLVSERWLARLAAELAARSMPFYAALSYDGRIAFTPSDPLDTAITTAVNAHQRTDKGFGPALGPAAADSGIMHFEALGYSVVHGPSDWNIGPGEREMQTELLAGWASATRDIGTLSSADTTAWLKRRGELVAAGRSSLQVGHIDFFAAPSTTRCAERSQSNSTSSSILCTRIGIRGA
jgi:hypothetical protein